jgi:hypothetical protein
MTVTEFQGWVFPPVLRARTKQLTAPRTRTPATQSMCSVWLILDLSVRCSGLDPRGGDVARRRLTTTKETAPLRTGRC